MRAAKETITNAPGPIHTHTPNTHTPNTQGAGQLEKLGGLVSQDRPCSSALLQRPAQELPWWQEPPDAQTYLPVCRQRDVQVADGGLRKAPAAFGLLQEGEASAGLLAHVSDLESRAQEPSENPAGRQRPRRGPSHRPPPETGSGPRVIPSR